MTKFRESDLTENLKNFETETKTEIKFERGLDGRMILEDATIKYDADVGFINIQSKNAELKINTTLVDEYKKNNDEIIINLENIMVKMRKID